MEHLLLMYSIGHVSPLLRNEQNVVMVVRKSLVRFILFFDIPRTLCRSRFGEKKAENMAI